MRRPAAARLAGIALLLGACAEEDGPPPVDPAVLALGREVYVKSCASCHGPAGEGQPAWQTPNAVGELPAPPHDSTGHTWKHSDRMLQHIVAQGWRDPFNRTERLTMPAFQDLLSDEEIRAVITYLKTLWTDEQRRFQWTESRDEPFVESAGAEAGAMARSLARLGTRGYSRSGSSGRLAGTEQE